MRSRNFRAAQLRGFAVGTSDASAPIRANPREGIEAVRLACQYAGGTSKSKSAKVLLIQFLVS